MGPLVGTIVAVGRGAAGRAVPGAAEDVRAVVASGEGEDDRPPEPSVQLATSNAHVAAVATRDRGFTCAAARRCNGLDAEQREAKRASAPATSYADDT